MLGSKECTLPADYQHQFGRLRLQHEEEAAVWLWTWSDLLCWPRPVEWLYSPVVGNTLWPGDLWGVDAEGELLVVEGKNRRDVRKAFDDFPCRYTESLKASTWRRRWRHHYDAELSWGDSSTDRGGDTAGLLPRSNHRRHIRRWPECATEIHKRLRHPAYADRVSEFLTTREGRGDPPPHYLALVVNCRAGQPLLTPMARDSMARLAAQVGADRVSVVDAFAERAEGSSRVIVHLRQDT